MKDYLPAIITITVSSVTFVIGVVTATNNAVDITREQTIIDCITKPKECKIEYDYYLLNKE